MRANVYMSISEGKTLSPRYRLNFPERLLNIAKLHNESDASALSSLLHNLEKYRRELAESNPALSIIMVINKLDNSIESELPF